jgi:nitrogen fixation protein FixH
MAELRQATIEDFKQGTTLITSENYGFTILRKYDDGIWEARGTEGQGDKCVFENEARFYKVEVNNG